MIIKKSYSSQRYQLVNFFRFFSILILSPENMLEIQKIIYIQIYLDELYLMIYKTKKFFFYATRLHLVHLTQIPCLHIPQNCEIPPKSQIFSKTPPRFAHWEDQNLKPTQTDRARRALSNGYDFIWFESLDPLRKGKSTSQCWSFFSVKAMFFFEKHENCTDRAIFWGILYYRGNSWKMCFAYTFRFMLLSFYLSENRERAPSFNLWFYHYWRYFTVLGDMKAWDLSRNQSIR